MKNKKAIMPATIVVRLFGFAVSYIILKDVFLQSGIASASFWAIIVSAGIVGISLKVPI